MNTIEKLNQLAEFHAAKQSAELAKQALIDQILTPEIRAKIAEIEAEFEAGTEAVHTKIAELEAEIKTDVIQAGATIKAEYMQAVYAKGRVSWDTKALDGYAAAHPEIAQFKKTGDPSVSFRFNK